MDYQYHLSSGVSPTPGEGRYDKPNPRINKIKRKPLPSSSTEPLNPARALSQPPPYTATVKHNVLRFWYWEMVILFIAVGLMIAMMVLLGKYNGHELPKWPYGIGINSLIALLSTLFRASLLVIVSEVISQAKWSWFLSPRRLQTMGTFDGASRGIWGSIKLLSVAFRSPIAILGALITILSLAIGPFTQQAIRTTLCDRLVDSSNATVPIASYLPGISRSWRYGVAHWQPQPDAKGYMVNGLVNPGSNDTTISATCPTGNCTFDRGNDGVTYQTLAVCSKCIDTSGYIQQFSNMNYTANNYTSEYYQIYPNYTIIGTDRNWTVTNYPLVSDISPFLTVGEGSLEFARDSFPPDFANVIGDTFVNVTVLAFTKTNCAQSKTCRFDINMPDSLDGKVDDVFATSCGFYPCLYRINAAENLGVLHEELIGGSGNGSGNSIPARINWDDTSLSSAKCGSPCTAYMYYNFTAIGSPCVVEGVEYDSSNISLAKLPEGEVVDGDFIFNVTTRDANGKRTLVTAPERCLFNVQGQYAFSLQQFMSDYLLGGDCTYNKRQGSQVDCGKGWWLTVLFNDWAGSYASTEFRIASIASSMTTFFRNTGFGIMSRKQEVAHGKVWETTVCIVFDWQWMILPIVLLLGAIAALLSIIAAVWMDKSVPIWKSNVIPLMFYAGEVIKGKPQGRGLMDLNGVEEEAGGWIVKLQNGDDSGFVEAMAGYGSVHQGHKA